MQKPMMVREYAREQGVTIDTVYRQLWNGKLRGEQHLGRWLIVADNKDQEQNKQEVVAHG